VRKCTAPLPAIALTKAARLFVKMRVGRIRDDVVQIGSDRPDVFRDRPFVVVQHDDETLGLRFGVVERFVTDPAGERGIARHDDDVFIAAAQIASDRHAEPSGKRRAGVTGAVAIVFAFRAQKKSVQPLVLPHRADAIEPAGKHFVDVTLVADVEDETVPRRIEDAMQRDRQLDHAEIRSEMSAGLREDFDQLIAHFLRELRQIAGPRTPSSRRVPFLEESDVIVILFLH
jgi:hypothetical protein